MGNTASSHPGQAGSIRSRSSRRSRVDGADQNRVSQAISFYQTPPGSFDLGRRPLSETSTDFPEFRNLNAGATIEESDEEPTLAPVQESRRWKAGVYSLVNVQSGTVLDLSAADDKSLIGFPPHSGKNQQWHFEPFGDGYTIRSMSSGRYLTVEDELSHTAPLVATAFPIAWKVQAMVEGPQVIIRILWPTERFAISLDSGSSTAGAKVKLENASAEESRQRWRLVEHEAPPLAEPQDAYLALKQQNGDSTSVETAVVSESPDCITTTRTTTTTTISTVTIVVKTPLQGIAIASPVHHTPTVTLQA